MNTLNKNTVKEPWMLLDLLVIVYLAHKILMVVGYWMPALVYLGVFLLTALFLVQNMQRAFSFTITARLIAVFSVSILTVVFYLINGAASSVPLYLYSQLQVFLYAWIALWYNANTSDTRVKRILLFIALAYLITCVTTYIGCINYPLASRYMASHNANDATYRFYTSQNIGSFTFTYELVLLAPLVIYLLKARKINRFLGAAALVVMGLVILETEYTAAVMSFVFTLILLFIRKPTAKKITVFLLVCVLFFLINSLFLADVFEKLAQSMSSDSVISERFQYLADILNGRSVSSDSYDRVSLYQESWQTFFDTHLLGTWSNVGSGGHSMILDTLATFGLVGLVAIVLMYRSIYTLFIRPHRDEPFYPYLYWILVVGIIFALINPRSLLFIFFCVIPLFARLMKTSDPVKEEHP